MSYVSPFSKSGSSNMFPKMACPLGPGGYGSRCFLERRNRFTSQATGTATAAVRRAASALPPALFDEEEDNKSA